MSRRRRAPCLCAAVASRPRRDGGRLAWTTERGAGRLPGRGARALGRRRAAVAGDQSDLRARRSSTRRRRSRCCRYVETRTAARPGPTRWTIETRTRRHRRGHRVDGRGRRPCEFTWRLGAAAADLRRDAAGRRRPTWRGFDSLVVHGQRRSADAGLGAAAGAGRRGPALGPLGVSRRTTARDLACRSTPCCRSGAVGQSRPPLAEVTALLVVVPTRCTRRPASRRPRDRSRRCGLAR